MKCEDLQQDSLADAYRKALGDADSAGGTEVTMDHLAPHLAETGSSCGACSVLLPLARKAFDAQEAQRVAVDAAAGVQADRAHAVGEGPETTAEMVGSALREVLPIPVFGGPQG